MNFPLDNPIFRFLYWFVNTPGVGSLGIGFLIIACLGSFAAALRWIVRGAGPMNRRPTLIRHRHSTRPSAKGEKPWRN